MGVSDKVVALEGWSCFGVGGRGERHFEIERDSSRRMVIKRI